MEFDISDISSSKTIETKFAYFKTFNSKIQKENVLDRNFYLATFTQIDDMKNVEAQQQTPMIFGEFGTRNISIKKKFFRALILSSKRQDKIYNNASQGISSFHKEFFRKLYNQPIVRN